MTDYIVLRRKAPQNWDQIGVHRCNGPDVAIREIANNEPGVYVAVPTRSWHERDGTPVRIERFALTGKDAPVSHPGQTTVEEALAEDPSAPVA